MTKYALINAQGIEINLWRKGEVMSLHPLNHHPIATIVSSKVAIKTLGTITESKGLSNNRVTKWKRQRL